MRLIALALLALLTAAFSNPARVRTAERVYREDGHTYFVDYEYSKDLIETPASFATGINQHNTHYEAEVTVYESVGHRRILVGSPFDGYYTELGCVEDNPATLVHRALSLVVPETRQANVHGGPALVRRHNPD